MDLQGKEDRKNLDVVRVASAAKAEAGDAVEMVIATAIEIETATASLAVTALRQWKTMMKR